LPSRPPDDRSPEEIFLEHRAWIEKIATRVARRRGLSEAETEDFAQDVQLKLVEDDYRRIREFQGRSSFKTYLTTVITRLAKDHCNHLWGKWRASAPAKRLGWEARLLERLRYREGFSFEEAAEKMRREYQLKRSVEELAELDAKLPQRTSRRFEGEEALENRPVPETAGERVDRRVADGEKAEQAGRVEAALQAALEELESEDCLILKYYFRGRTLARIARSLGLEQKPLYRRRDRILAQIRKSMETRGVRWEDVQRILGWERLDLRLLGGPEDPGDDHRENGDPGPSN
jgi:RNA polymerase sigma factor (sigma-70 family)